MEELERLLKSDKKDFKKFDREAYLLYSLLQVKTGRKKDGGMTTTLYDWCIAINSGK
jgi:hypothetical protein